MLACTRVAPVLAPALALALAFNSKVAVTWTTTTVIHDDSDGEYFSSFRFCSLVTPHHHLP